MTKITDHLDEIASDEEMEDARSADGETTGFVYWEGPDETPPSILLARELEERGNA